MNDFTVEVSAFLALIAPGLLFEVGLARSLNYLRRPLGDRVLRFGAWSVLYHAMLLPFTTSLWMSWSDSEPDNSRLIEVWTWALAVTFVPLLLGYLVGRYAREQGALRDLVLGRDPAPLAWHHAFDSLLGHEAWIRVRTREGGWIAGRWAYSSDEPEDILISPRYACDTKTGELHLDKDGFPKPLGWQCLLRIDDLDRIEMEPIKGESNG